MAAGGTTVLLLIQVTRCSTTHTHTLGVWSTEPAVQLMLSARVVAIHRWALCLAHAHPSIPGVFMMGSSNSSCSAFIDSWKGISLGLR